MISSRVKLLAILGPVILGLAALAALPAAGQSSEGCPDGDNCIDASTFDTGFDGWTAGVSQSALEHLDYKTLGLASDAAGVLKVSGSGFTIIPGIPPTTSQYFPTIRKTYYLEPGYYQVVMRAGEDLDLASADISTVKFWADPFQGSYGALSPWYFQEFRTQIFSVSHPGSVIVEIVNTKAVYYDWIYLERRADTDPTPTATPVIYTQDPNLPTPTASATPIPPAAQATPPPVPTAYCQSGPEPPPAQFITQTIESLARLETFYGWDPWGSMGSWERLGDIERANQADHTGDVSGSAMLYYDNDPPSNAIVLPTSDLTGTYYVNAWAEADVVPAGSTAYLEIWALNGSWARLAQVAIGAQRWYPAHVQIDTEPEALAFVGTRTDQPSAGFIYVDDIYIYAPDSMAPFCDGSYPRSTTGIDGSGSLLSNGAVSLSYPGDKPCPAPILTPNNFWGMLLAQITLFLDSQMAWSPLHILGTTRDLANQFMLGPLGAVIVIATLVFDWQIPVIMFEVYLAFQAGLAIIGIWKVIRRAFIF